MHWFGTLLMAALLALAPASGSAQPAGEKGASPAAEPKVQGTEAPAPAVKSYPPKERQAYEKKAAADLEQLQQQINGLMTEDIKPQMRRALARARLGLQKKVAAAHNQLATLEKSSAQDWGRLKIEMDKAMEELRKEYQKIKASLQ